MDTILKICFWGLGLAAVTMYVPPIGLEQAVVVKKVQHSHFSIFGT
jgi:hypothetical protein